MERFLSWLRELFTSKRTALLEAENERLRDSLEVILKENVGLRKNNEALINTALCEAGKPSLPGSEVSKPPAITMRSLTPHQKQRKDIIEQTRTGLRLASHFAQNAEKKIRAEG